MITHIVTTHTQHGSKQFPAEGERQALKHADLEADSPEVKLVTVEKIIAKKRVATLKPKRRPLAAAGGRS